VKVSALSTPARMVTARSRDLDAFKHRDQLRAVAPLAERGQQSWRPTTAPFSMFTEEIADSNPM
jgi:hypothetical protein